MTCRSQCPHGVCDCRSYYDPFSPPSPSIVSRIKKAQSLRESNEEGEMIHDMMNTTNPHEFASIRESIRERYGIIFLIKGRGKVTVEESPGLCRKTRKKIRETLNELFSTNPELLIGILNRDSLFDDRNFLDNIGYEQES